VVLLLYHACGGLSRHEQSVGVVGGDMAVVSTVLQLMVIIDQVVVVNHGCWLSIMGGDMVGIAAG